MYVQTPPVARRSMPTRTRTGHGFSVCLSARTPPPAHSGLVLACAGGGACLCTSEGLQPLMSRVHRTVQEAKPIGARAAAPSPLAQPSPPQRHAPSTRGLRSSECYATNAPIANKNALPPLLPASLTWATLSLPQWQHTTAAKARAFALSVGASGGGGRRCCREKDSVSPSQSLLQGRALREWRDDGRATSVR